MNELEQTVLDINQAQEILRLAAGSRRRMDTFSTDDLVRAAAELDIAPEHVHHAEQIVREMQSELDDRAEFRRAKAKETMIAWLTLVPVALIVVGVHAFGVMAQVFSGLKGGVKGLSGLFFSKATSHELAFQEWRNKRYYIAEFGSTDAGVILSHYTENRLMVTYGDAFEWLVDRNGIEPSAAIIAIDKWAKRNPQIFQHSGYERANEFRRQQKVLDRDLSLRRPFRDQ
jgi:hypothetical protein